MDITGRCGCGNRMTPREDGGCSCMCHPANQEREDARIQRMLAEREAEDHG
jgi:hypothetical protein